ncbi:hypothetical protein RCL_jg22265.t1 [Rhizophagus clarus]|uniref:CCHC-type domain-containing protein n=1 Tax=Rhizophagus clarus TaxID=94130 RepID=A0A8H3LF69_9GLOM|nr:hypothetical protein RCL_jg22265.t1 [Rhizophagus clarus]
MFYLETNYIDNYDDYNEDEYEINYIDRYNEGENYEEYYDDEEIYEINHDMYPVQTRRRERNPDIVVNEKRDRRMASTTTESTRKLKSTCMNCEQQGHFTKDCQNERVSNIVNEMQREVPSYNILEDIKDMRANATFGQIYNESPR